MPPHPDESVLRSPTGSSAAERRAQEIMQSTATSTASARLDVVLPAGQTTLRSQTAALFAAGEIRSAINGLLNEFNRRAGEVDRSLWYLLLDIYQIQNDRESYEKLAEIFSGHFRTSPPAWAPYPDQVSTPGVVNVLVINGIPTITAEKNRDFLRAAKLAGTCRLDFSRMRLGLDYLATLPSSPASPAASAPSSRPSPAPASRRSASGSLPLADPSISPALLPPEPALLASLEGLVKTMARLRQFRVKVTLMGEELLVQKISALVQADRLNDPTYIPYWLFLLECWQWRGREEEYEAVALKFITTFELSPPGFEASGIIAISPSKPSATPVFAFPDTILPVSLEEIYTEINTQLGQSGQVTLDFADVKRISFDAATEFALFLKNLAISAKLLTFKNLNEVLLAIFDLTGISQLTFSTGKKH